MQTLPISEVKDRLNEPGIHESIAEARRDVSERRTFTEAEMREEFGVPKRRP